MFRMTWGKPAALLLLLLLARWVGGHTIAEMLPREVHVNPAKGSDSADWCGDEDSPCATLRGMFDAINNYQAVRKYVDKKPPDAFLIQLHPGTYRGDLNRNIEISYNVSLRAWDGPGTVTIDLERRGRAFSFQSTLHEFAQIEGLRFINGLSKVGGAVVGNETHIQMYDCVFEDNESTGPGGAVWIWVGHYMFDQELTVIDRCEFRRNKARKEGGAAALEWMRSVVQNSVFEDNESTDGYGGAVHAHSGQGMYYDNKFLRNKAKSHGGAIHVRGTHLHVYRSLFEDNRGWTGGAIWTSMGPHSEMNDSIFRGNRASVAGGALIVKERTALKVTNCDFINNVAGATGGATSADAAHIWIVHSRFIGNRLDPTPEQLKEFWHLWDGKQAGMTWHCADAHYHFEAIPENEFPPMGDIDRDNPMHCDKLPMGTHCRLHGSPIQYCRIPGKAKLMPHDITHRWHRYLKPYFGTFFDKDRNIIIVAAVISTTALIYLLVQCCLRASVVAWKDENGVEPEPFYSTASGWGIVQERIKVD